MFRLEGAGLSSLNEGAKVSYEEMENRGKTSAKNLSRLRSVRVLRGRVYAKILRRQFLMRRAPNVLRADEVIE